MKVGVALSGGGIRCIAHIGVLKAIEELDFTVDEISGASSGALIGALYASGFSPDEIYNFSEENSIISMMSPKFSLLGLSSLDGIEKRLSELIGEDSFESLNIPLYVSATDLNEGKNIIFSSGKLYSVIKASCSIPVLFSPVMIEGNAYADGGIMNNLPTRILRNKVDLLIGVNLIANPKIDKSDLSNIFRVAMRTFELNVYTNSHDSLKICDIQIHPKELAKISIFRHKNVEEIFNIGYRAGIDSLSSYKE